MDMQEKLQRDYFNKYNELYDEVSFEEYQDAFISFEEERVYVCNSEKEIYIINKIDYKNDWVEYDVVELWESGERYEANGCTINEFLASMLTDNYFYNVKRVELDFYYED